MLSQYIQQESITGDERHAATWLANACRKKGLHVEYLTTGDSTTNLVASLYPLSLGKPNIVFQHHVDVVPPGPLQDWTYPPFSGAVVSGKIWGRGSLDDKCLGIMQLIAMEAFIEQAALMDLPYNVSILAVSGEEDGGYTGSYLVSGPFKEHLNAVCVFGEGGAGLPNLVANQPRLTVFGVSVAEKRTLWLQLDLKMKSYGHGAAPPANYANRSMLRSLNRLNDLESKIVFNKTNKRMFKAYGNLEGGLRGFAISHIHWWIFRPVLKSIAKKEPVINSLVRNTTVLTNIFNPPGPPNQISSRVSAYVDSRLLPNTNTERFIKQIQKGLFEPRFNVRILEEGMDAPESDPNNIYYQAFEYALLRNHKNSAVVPILFPASSDNNYYRALGIPTYGILPFKINQEQLEAIHNFNEFIFVDQVLDGTAVYSTFLEQMLGVSATASAQR